MALKRMYCGALALSISIFACSDNPIETVEAKDDQGRLERFERRKKDFAKHGKYQRFYENGALAVEAFYQHDTLHGVQKFFYRNGKVESEEHLKNGQYHGPYRKYYEDGTLQIEQTYVDGAMQGFSVAYYPNGKVREKVTIKDNEENGPFTEYYESGTVMTEGNYGKDTAGEVAEQGELKEYDSTGVLIRIANCIDGACLTKWKKQ